VKDEMTVMLIKEMKWLIDSSKWSHVMTVAAGFGWTRGITQLSDMWVSGEESDRDDRSETVPSERQAALKKSMCSCRHLI
jgi:hypothetical protein